MTDADTSGPRCRRSAALVRDFVNTVDHELGTDALRDRRRPHGVPDRPRDCWRLRTGPTRRSCATAVGLRGALHEALELNHAARARRCRSSTTSWAGCPSAWPGTARASSPDRRRTGSAGRSPGSASLPTRRWLQQVWWRLKICAFDECEWAYFDQSKNRSRSYCEYGCGNKLKTRAYRARQRSARYGS